MNFDRYVPVAEVVEVAVPEEERVERWTVEQTEVIHATGQQPANGNNFPQPPPASARDSYRRPYTTDQILEQSQLSPPNLGHRIPATAHLTGGGDGTRPRIPVPGPDGSA